MVSRGQCLERLRNLGPLVSLIITVLPLNELESLKTLGIWGSYFFTLAPVCSSQRWWPSHLFSVVRRVSHGSEIGAVWTGEYRRGNSPSGRPHWSGSFDFNGHQPQNGWKPSVAG